MKNIITRSLLAGCSALLLSFVSPVLTAGVLYETDFEGPIGSVPAYWDNMWTQDWPAQDGEGNLRLLRGSGNNGWNMAAYYGGDSASWTDYTVIADVEADPWTAQTAFFGLKARVTGDALANFSGYVFGVYGNGQLRLLNWINNSTTIIATTPVGTVSYVPGERWQLRLRVEGTTITGAVFGLTETGETGELLASVSAENSAYPSGSTGIVALLSPGDQVLYHNHRVLELAEIPHPVEIFQAVELRFDTASGTTYQVQRSTDLSQWENFGSAVMGSGTEITRFISTRDRDREFYRVVRDQE